MIIPDLNLLVYAYNGGAPNHARARTWWEGLLSGAAPVGLPWAVALGFVRLMTSRAVLLDPMPVGDAVARVSEWWGVENVAPLAPGPRHWPIFSSLLQTLGTGAHLVTDAHLAALAIEHQAELHSNDADFARFPGVRVVNPLR